MKSSGIGGQAVLEGIMMKNGSRYSVAVRKPDNKVEVKTDEFHSVSERIQLFKVPVFRGMAAFVESLVLGIRTLTWSAGLASEEQEEKEPAKKGSKTKETFADVGVVILSILMAVVVFILFPLAISSILGKLAGSETVQLLFEGVLRILMFVVYVALISRLNDIKRVFMYHGAEHKCINCIERGEELTVANVRRQSRCHKRCGTSFMLVVMLVSFVLFMFIRVETAWLRYVLRIVLVPLIAGISYEFIRLAGNSENKVVVLLSKPGLLLQGLTTKEPDDSMIETGIAAVESVFDWRAYQEQEGIAKYLKRSKGKKKQTENKRTEQIEKLEVDKAVSTATVEELGGGKSELTSLDHLFASRPSDEKELAAAAKENQETMKKKVHAGYNTDTIHNAHDEDDDILRALDRYFVYNSESEDEKDKKE